MSAEIRPLEVESIALEGTHLIEAGAGTGKTHTIVSLYVRLLLERGLDVSQILVVTYTVAATAELRSRIRRRLVELVPQLEQKEGGDPELARVREALRSFDRAAIFTIHGFCQRALAEHAFESGGSFESELLSDQGALVDEVAEDFFARELHDGPGLCVGYVTRKLNLARLRALAERVSSRLDLRVRPERSGVPGSPELRTEIASQESRWLAAWEPVARAWPDCRSEVVELLETACRLKALNGHRYRKNYLEGWVPKLDAVLRARTPGLEASFDRFGRFAQSELRDSTKKGQVTPEHPFFDLCDALLAHESRARLRRLRPRGAGVPEARAGRALLRRSPAAAASCPRRLRGRGLESCDPSAPSGRPDRRVPGHRPGAVRDLRADLAREPGR
jgi:exodeoxyribonuclease V beta subunit